ncbi:RICIN domain-containing protein [Streptomyces sp. NPDC056231]|uniref:RICIN domain-containing protein n=1 Tax=Streptomyces sp. NPDC056231 TaxID=3345755 RepID=UPI003AADD397
MRIRTAAASTLTAAALGIGLTAAPAEAAFRTNIEIDLADGFCLDVPNSNFSNGVTVQEWTCNHTNAQKWNLVFQGSHYFQIQSAAAPSLCLNNWSSGGAKGDYIKLYSCSSGDSLFNEVGPEGGWNNYFEFQPKNASANCVTAWGGSAQGHQMRLDSCSRNWNNLFDLYDLVYSD